jgi:hypothetical protein
MVEDRLASVDLSIVQSAHALSHEGARYFGMMQVRNGTEDADWSTVIGLRNSNDMSFSSGLVVGSGVFVCDNLCFSGEIKVGRKHTKNILEDLPALVIAALEQIGGLREFQARRIEAYKTAEFTHSQANDLIIAGLDRGVISSSKVGSVLAEWREPSHPEFAEGLTGWRMMNAFTEVLKPRPKSDDLQTLPQKGERLHEILDVACEVIAA